MPIPCDVPGAICNNACASGATDGGIDGDIIMVKFAAERDGWKKQRLERYARWETSAAPSCKNVSDISFRLAGQLRVGVL